MSDVMTKEDINQKSLLFKWGEIINNFLAGVFNEPLPKKKMPFPKKEQQAIQEEETQETRPEESPQEIKQDEMPQVTNAQRQVTDKKLQKMPSLKERIKFFISSTNSYIIHYEIQGLRHHDPITGWHQVHLMKKAPIKTNGKLPSEYLEKDGKIKPKFQDSYIVIKKKENSECYYISQGEATKIETLSPKFSTFAAYIGSNRQSIRLPDKVIADNINPNHQVDPLGDIILGAMPEEYRGASFINSTNHDHKIKTKCAFAGKFLGLVVATVESWERKFEDFHKSVDWEKRHDIQVKEVPIVDYSIGKKNLTDKYQDILDAVQSIDDTRKAGKSVYIHCKAGKSRSVFVLMCYLTTAYKDPTTQKALSVEDAYHLIKKHRPQITFEDKRKWQAVEDFKEHYNNNKLDLKTEVHNRMI